MRKTLTTTNKAQLAPIVASPVNSPAPSHEAIARVAYYRAEQRGFAPGGEVSDWFEAEHELRQALIRG